MESRTRTPAVAPARAAVKPMAISPALNHYADVTNRLEQRISSFAFAKKIRFAKKMRRSCAAHITVTATNAGDPLRYAPRFFNPRVGCCWFWQEVVTYNPVFQALRYRLGIVVRQDYFRVADPPEVIRPVLRQTVHPPYRRASFRHRA